MNICIAGNPSKGLGGDRRDRFTGKRIAWDGWSDLFHDVLLVPQHRPYQEGESFIDYERETKNDFSQFLIQKGYPLLSRIDDIYGDSVFLAGEIKDLRNECRSLLSAIGDASRPGKRVLENLVAACDSASEVESGLILSGD